MPNRERTLDPLKDEELEHIFSFLDTNGKLNASIVCKEWMRIFNECPCLLRNVRVNFYKIRATNLSEIFTNLSRNFCYFHFYKLKIDAEWFLFLEKHGWRFHRWVIVHCKLLIDVEDPGRKLLSFTNLSELKMWGSDLLDIISHLPALKTLFIEISDSISEQDVKHLQQVVPLTLTRLDIEGLVYGDKNFKKMIYRELEAFIQNRRMFLESLDITGLEIPDRIVDRISKIEGWNLKRLKLSFDFLLDSTIENFCRRQRSIVALELEECSSPEDQDERAFFGLGPPTDSNVLEICTILPRLQELSFCYCNGFNESVVAIFQLPLLKRLSLYGCRGITKRSFRLALRTLACSKLRVLNLSHTHIGRRTLSKLLNLVPNLGEITLSHSHYLDSKWVEVLPRHEGQGMKFVRQPK